MAGSAGIVGWAWSVGLTGVPLRKPACKHLDFPGAKLLGRSMNPPHLLLGLPCFPVPPLPTHLLQLARVDYVLNLTAIDRSDCSTFPKRTLCLPWGASCRDRRNLPCRHPLDAFGPEAVVNSRFFDCILMEGMEALATSPPSCDPSLPSKRCTMPPPPPSRPS